MGLFDSVKKVAKTGGGFVGGVMPGMAQMGYNALTAGSGKLPPNGRVARIGAYNEQQIALEHQREAERLKREQALGDLDKAFADPSRTAGREAQYGANLNNQLQGLQYDFNQNSQHAGLSAARRGRLGSSYDQEVQGGLQAGLQSNIAGAQQASYGQLQALQQNDIGQHEALRRSILAGNPQEAQLYGLEARNYGDLSAQMLQRAQDEAEARRIRDAGRYANYQAAGDTLSSFGSGIRNGYGYYNGGF